ncbi:MAG: cobalamin-binding protein [Actinomycetota bacterium]|nr:cobalamin-binding protein [Actinomycetota bacterium]
MRIISLLPSATEILFDLGAGDDVVGVTFECDYPAQARERTIVSFSAMPEGLTPRQIDDFVTAAMARGDELYRLDADALRGLDADLVITQDLCAVCAVDVSTVDDALTYLGCRAEVVTLDPHTLDEVLTSIGTVGRLTGRSAQADRNVSALRTRLADVASAVAGRPRPRVMLLEWTEPPFAPGHWIPEMVTAAGGECVLGSAGQKSVRTTWEAIRAASPDVIVSAPCGFHAEAAADLTRELLPLDVLPDGVPVWAVDANSSFARPAARLVDGVEALAAILHPDVAPTADATGSTTIRIR